MEASSEALKRMRWTGQAMPSINIQAGPLRIWRAREEGNGVETDGAPQLKGLMPGAGKREET